MGEDTPRLPKGKMLTVKVGAGWANFQIHKNRPARMILCYDRFRSSCNAPLCGWNQSPEARHPVALPLHDCLRREGR